MVVMSAPPGGRYCIGRWPHQGPGKGIPRVGAPTESIDHLADVVVPTVAVGAPGTQAPSEREDESEDMGRGPPSHAVTCMLNTSPTNSVSGTRVAPRAHFVAKK